MITIPTALSPREVSLLQRAARNKRALDVGSLLGYSTIKLSEVATLVTSLDKHEGYSVGPTLEPLKNNIFRYAKTDVAVNVGEAKEVSRLVGEVAFIDLTGKKALTLQTLDALPLDVTLALVRDCQRSKCEGVEEAIKDAVRWEPCGQVDTMVILGRKYGK